jgi:hypothetical protein
MLHEDEPDAARSEIKQALRSVADVGAQGVKRRDAQFVPRAQTVQNLKQALSRRRRRLHLYMVAFGGLSAQARHLLIDAFEPRTSQHNSDTHHERLRPAQA